MSQAQVHEACQRADLPTLQALILQSPHLVDVQDVKYGWSPLHRALICGHHSVVQMLLKMGADPNLKTAVGEPPLYLAADLNQPALVQQLLSSGADPNCRNADGETPLHVATFKASESIMELLLTNGADPSLRDLVVRTHLV